VRGKPTEQITVSAPAFHALQRAADREGVRPDYIVELLVCWFLEDPDGRPFRGDRTSSALAPARRRPDRSRTKPRHHGLAGRRQAF
jgi:hypothetical protein